jgi:hypothetical protein
MAIPSPLGVLFNKTVQFQGKLFTTFLQAAVAGPIPGIDFLRKFEDIVSPEISQIQFLVQQQPCPPIFCLQRLRPPHFVCLARHRSRLWF